MGDDASPAGTLPPSLHLRPGLAEAYPDVLTAEVLGALDALSPFNEERRALMEKRLRRRLERARSRTRIAFLDPSSWIPRTSISVQEAREGKFVGGDIPLDLQCQWIQGTGPATRPNASVEEGLRHPAFALLSGADGWMFDGEDALGQTATMSLDNHRNLILALARHPLFLSIAEEVASEMNAWSSEFLGRRMVEDWRKQLDATTRLFRPRGLHLDDRHIRDRHGRGFSASLVDTVLYIVNNFRRLKQEGRAIALYLPKVQTAEEAGVWNEILSSLESHLGLAEGTIKCYVLIEQVEAAFQLMEIRAALARRFVGYNTGRWDYIHSVADAMSWDPSFLHPDIDRVAMTWGYMRAYEDRVRRAANTPDQEGRCVLWQGGMEANIPVGGGAGVSEGMKRALAGAAREEGAGASGKWVAHWKMVPFVREVWARAGRSNQLGRAFPHLTYTQEDADALLLVEPAPRTVQGARALLSVALQYANAFGQGMQSAALKPADAFGDDDVLYLMEDMATGEIRMGILWEWLHKAAPFTEDDGETGVRAGDRLDGKLLFRLFHEEVGKLERAADRDVHDRSKGTTLPIAAAIAREYLLSHGKPPWCIDLLNLTLDEHDLSTNRGRIGGYLDRLHRHGTRLTENPEFSPVRSPS